MGLGSVHGSAERLRSSPRKTGGLRGSLERSIWGRACGLIVVATIFWLWSTERWISRFSCAWLPGISGCSLPSASGPGLALLSEISSMLSGAVVNRETLIEALLAEQAVPPPRGPFPVQGAMAGRAPPLGGRDFLGTPYRRPVPGNGEPSQHFTSISRSSLAW